MPSARELLSSVVMTAIGVAVIFRLDFLRDIVTGIKVDALPAGAAAGTKRTLYV